MVSLHDGEKEIEDMFILLTECTNVTDTQTHTA